MSESQIMREGWAEMVKAGGKLWRNNVGQGIVGKSRWVGRTAMVENASRIQYGLCVGSPDLVGHLSTVITQDMVGKRIAIAVYAEAKTPEGRIRPEQTSVRRNYVQPSTPEDNIPPPCPFALKHAHNFQAR